MRDKPSHGSESLIATLQQKHSLFAEEIPNPPRRAEADRRAGAIKGDSALDVRAEFVDDLDEVTDGAKMNVRRVMPVIVRVAR